MSQRCWHRGTLPADVYLAEDTKLGRKIALKVLPPELAESEERRARFKREAKALAVLDHPNIVQVFSVEEAEGIHFITMQLVHGKTLTELLPNFALSRTTSQYISDKTRTIRATPG